MLSLDISRDSFQRSKNYSSLRQQQGRVPLDSELNEATDILAEELRRAIQEVICASGTPNDGFRITFPDDAAVAAYDFAIAAGSYYIGGLRYDMPAPARLRSQPDWLQIALDLDPPPARPAPQIGGPVRHDFVHLEGWEQEVSATEDSELFERALGGADGAGRRRRMARVRVITGSAATCLQAMAEAFPGSGFDPATGALASGAGLTIDFDPTTLDDNLCAPQVQSGFLGAENETFRIQLTAADRFIYGRDNAAHLYRVTLEAVPGDPAATPPVPERTRVHFLTLPRDVHSQPLAGQAVELLRWNTRLPNGEKLAEPQGALATIAADFDPTDGTLLIEYALDPAWTAWFGAEGAAAINPLDGGEEDAYFYLRLWTGGSGDAAAPDHAIPGTTPIALPGTGLTAAFAATGVPGSFGRAGDHWIVAARPNAPDVVTPWRLLDSSPETPPPAPPMGPVRHVAPLALITWTPDAAGIYSPELHDCRERFRKLCRIGTCCEVTVGDGTHSHGDVDSIADALERLPDGGGRICLLRGHHVASVTLKGRTDVTFTGCGAETVWSAADGPNATLIGCRGIAFVDFVMQAEGSDIVLAGARDGETPADERSRELRFERMILLGRDRSALWLNDCDEVTVRETRVLMRPLSVGRAKDPDAGTDAALFLLGAGITVERSSIAPEGTPPEDEMPLCGIQIGGMSRGVALHRNRIFGGKGNGITLGHLDWLREVVPGATGRWSFGTGWQVNDAGCLVPRFVPTPPAGSEDEVLVPVSGGEIRDLAIEDNVISGMGLNGIAVCHFFDLATREDFIALADTRIARNLIEGCVTSDLAAPPLEIAFFMSCGGIALAACDLIEIEANVIRDNAVAVTAPNCGIFILTGAAIVIEGNRIHANGAPPGPAALPLGRRGGVCVGWCLTHPTEDKERAASPRRAALSVCGNFVDSSHGQALKAVALGPVRVTDNQLIGAGADPITALQMIGFLIQVQPVVSSVALGLTSLVITPEITRQSFANAGTLLAELVIMAMGGSAVSVFNVAWLEELAEFLSDKRGFWAVGGETLFNDNQVSLMPHGRQAGMRVSSVLVASLDDVSVANNQLEIEPGGFVLTNCFAPAATVRMTANRMQEPLFRSLFSGVSHAVLLNSQSLNQGTMCFVAHALLGSGPPHVQQRYNQSLVDLIPVGEAGICALLVRYLSALLGQDTFVGAGEFGTGAAGAIRLDPGTGDWQRRPDYVLGGYPMAYRLTTGWALSDT